MIFYSFLTFNNNFQFYRLTKKALLLLYQNGNLLHVILKNLKINSRKTIHNIFHNIISNETFPCSDRNLPWLNDKII